MIYQMICSDVDGTLLNEDHEVTEKTREAILQCGMQGIVFAIASARSPAGIEPIIQKNGFSCCIIAYNGALILDEQRKVLYEHGMTQNEARQIIQQLEESGLDLTWNVYTKDRWIVKKRSDPRVQREEQIVEAQAEEARPEALPEETIVDKILCMVAPACMEETEAILKEKFPACAVVRSSDILIEITKKGIDKEQGMQKLCAYKNIGVDAVIAFGDHYNDLSMLRAAGCGVLMENAPEALKTLWMRETAENRRMLTADHNHDGIAQVLLGRDFR